MKKWDELPQFMQCDEIKEYYDVLTKKKKSLIVKRLFDILLSLCLLIILLIPMICIAILIKIDSKGPIYYRQERVTIYGKKFKIHKFRTMVINADKIGTAVTIKEDSRITKMGSFLRKYRLDEFPQLIDVLVGNMTFVGTRPEVTKYVEKYTNEMKATLLMRAGITSEASIEYKDEDELLSNAKNADKEYVNIILPQKMHYNLHSLKEFSLFNDFKTMLKTAKIIRK